MRQQKLGVRASLAILSGFTSYLLPSLFCMCFNVIQQQQKCIEYYAVEDMLTTDEEEKFGSISMMDHFQKIAREGQDPFTPVYVALYKRCC